MTDIISNMSRENTGKLETAVKHSGGDCSYNNCSHRDRILVQMRDWEEATKQDDDELTPLIQNNYYPRAF